MLATFQGMKRARLVNTMSLFCLAFVPCMTANQKNLEDMTKLMLFQPNMTDINMNDIYMNLLDNMNDAFVMNMTDNKFKTVEGFVMNMTDNKFKTVEGFREFLLGRLTNYTNDPVNSSSVFDGANNVTNYTNDATVGTPCNGGYHKQGNDTSCIACQPGYWCDGNSSHPCTTGLISPEKASTQEHCTCDGGPVQCTAVVSFNMTMNTTQLEFDRENYIYAVATSFSVLNASVSIVVSDQVPARRLLAAAYDGSTTPLGASDLSLPRVPGRRLLAATGSAGISVQTSVATTPAKAAVVASDTMSLNTELHRLVPGADFSGFIVTGAAVATTTAATTATTTTPTPPAGTPEPEEAISLVIWIVIASSGVAVVVMIAVCVCVKRRSAAAKGDTEEKAALLRKKKPPKQGQQYESAPYRAHHAHAEPASYVVMRIPQ